jgi:serine protease
MNASASRPFPLLPVFALAAAIAIVPAGCKRDEATAPPASTATPPPAPAPAQPPSHDLKPATGAVEANAQTIKAAEEQLTEAAKAAREKWRGKTFEEFEASVFKEPGEHGKYIVSGDIAIADRKQLQEFFDKLQQEDDDTAHGKLTAALIVNVVNGGVDVWTSQRKQQLGYCVSDDFGARKPAVLADMQAATQAWESAADLDFTHVAAQDGNCTADNQQVLFDVRPVDVDGQYLARAFFPSDGRIDRNVLIDNSAFELDPDETLQLVGILRHELGHALGWRHEHTRPEAGTCFEDSQFQPLTDYDAFSVMHYPQCNGGGDWSLTLTPKDELGAACIYGKGSGNTQDLDECTFRGPDAPAAGIQETKVFDSQSVAKDEKKPYGPFAVKPGSIATVKMTGTGSASGDPDLYVRYVGPPDTARWNCRPYLSHANETCELEVPANRNRIHVMVRGYAAGNYKLEITYTKP